MKDGWQINNNICVYIIVKNIGFLTGTGLYNWVTRRMSYEKQGLLILCQHLGSLLVLGWCSVAHFCSFLCCVFLRVCSVACGECCLCIRVVHSWISIRFFLNVYDMGLDFHLMWQPREYNWERYMVRYFVDRIWLVRKLKIYIFLLAITG